MDKFVQLPFVIPPPSGVEKTEYLTSLFLDKSLRSKIDMDARDRAVRIVEQTNAQTQSVEEVAQQIAKEQTLAPAQEETLKKEVEVIKEMDENIRRFNDQEVMIRDQIVALSQRYFSNPRDIKRFLNVFRFYFFLRAARQARGESVQSLEQMSRHIVLSLKWPEVVRWMRRNPPISGTKAKSAIAALEDIGGRSQNAHQWQKHVESELGLKVNQTPWLSDEDIWKFFRAEATEFAERDRLSASAQKGLW